MSDQGTPAPADQQNALMPQGATATPSGDSPLLAYMDQAHQQTAAQWGKLKEANARITTARGTLDSLVKLGDTVTQEDVVKGAGRLIGAGMGAEAVAGLLSEMPPDGEALQGWVMQQDQGLRQREQQLAQAKQLVGFKMGASALQVLAALLRACSRRACFSPSVMRSLCSVTCALTSPALARATSLVTVERCTMRSSGVYTYPAGSL